MTLPHTSTSTFSTCMYLNKSHLVSIKNYCIATQLVWLKFLHAPQMLLGSGLVSRFYTKLYPYISFLALPQSFSFTSKSIGTRKTSSAQLNLIISFFLFYCYLLCAVVFCHLIHLLNVPFAQSNPTL